MASGESSFEGLVLQVLRRHIPEHTLLTYTHESRGRGKTLQLQGQPIVEDVAEELREVRSELCDEFITEYWDSDSDSVTTVLRILSRRIERVRKKYDHNHHIIIPLEEEEESLAIASSGRSLNLDVEQEEVEVEVLLRSKQIVTALAEELSQLKPLLVSKLAEEFGRICDPEPNQPIRLVRIASFLLLLDLASVLDVSEFPVWMLGCLVCSYYMIDWAVPAVWTEYDPDFLSLLGSLVASAQPVSSEVLSVSGATATVLEVTSTDHAWKAKLHNLLTEDRTKPSDSLKTDIDVANDEKKNTSKPSRIKPQDTGKIRCQECISDHEANYNEDDSEDSEENSDCNAQFKIESDREELWMENPFLKDLDSTLRDSWGLPDEETGTFFHIPVSDLLKHFQEDCPIGKHNNIWEECMTWFKLNKSWSCMWCYFCNKSFSDRQSHMMHMEYVHKLALSHDESWLVPFVGKDYVEVREVGMDCEPNLEDFIACDSACSYFLVDTTKFSRIRINEAEKLGSTKQKQFLMVFKVLQDLLCRLRHLLSIKSKYLKSMGVVRCLQWHLFDEIHELDQQIKEVLGHINKLRHDLSNLCVYDYRLKILPSISSYIRVRFGRIGSLSSKIHDKIKIMVSSSLGCYDLLSDANFFHVEVLSGKVFIGRFRSNSTLRFAYTRLTLKFVGEWSFEGHMKRISGDFRYGGLSNWYMGTLWLGESSLNNDSETSEMETFRIRLDASLNDAVVEKLYMIEEEIASWY